MKPLVLVRFVMSLALAAPASVQSCDLQIVGAGLPRTGTYSLHDALGILGYRTYHMIEILHHNKLKHFDYWEAYFKGNMSVADFAEEVFDGYDAAADFPACNAWKDLARLYPNAKIIMTYRDSPELWWESVMGSALADNILLRIVKNILPFARAAKKAMLLMWKKEMGFDELRVPTAADRDRGLAFYNRQLEEVKAFDPERTLFFNVKEGWEPLCAVLGKPVPGAPFPRVNTRQDFRNRLYIMGAAVVAFPLIIVLAAFAIYLTVKRRLRSKRAEKPKQF